MTRKLAVTLAVAVLAFSACTTPGPAVRTAIQRFDDAIALVARSTGTQADDMAARVRSTMGGATDDALADTAERLAARTAWIDDVATSARSGGSAVDDPALRAMTGASCETLQFALENGDWPSQSEFAEILARNLLQQGLATDAFSLQEASDDVVEHLDTILNGSPDLPRLFLDTACFVAG